MSSSTFIYTSHSESSHSNNFFNHSSREIFFRDNDIFESRSRREQDEAEKKDRNRERERNENFFKTFEITKCSKRVLHVIYQFYQHELFED